MKGEVSMPLNPKLEKIVQKDFNNLFALGPQKVREIYNQTMAKTITAGAEVGLVINRTVKTAKRETPVRIYNPKIEGIHPVLVYIHGGGLVVGSIDGYDSICREITNILNCIVISIDYGLAPEHKFPEPVEECYQVTKWVYENAKKLNVNPEKIAIAGDSAGGTVTAVVSQLSRDRGEFPLVYQVMLYPVTDLVGQTKSRIENGEGFLLTNEAIDWCNQCYLRDLSEAKKTMASPLLAESFESLPAACIITAEYDPLRDEGEAYAKRLSDAGVEVYLKRYDGIIHGFFHMQGTMEEAQDALSLICTKLAEVFNK